MRIILKPGLLAVAPENDDDRAALAAWRGEAGGHVFCLAEGRADGVALQDLGPREKACREPINVVFDVVAPKFRPISNLAETPFVLRGRGYASVEGFWQGLRFEDEKKRAQIARLWGGSAKRAAKGATERDSFTYNGETFVRAGPAHRALMLEACRAKFAQNLEAREALLATGDRPLTHRPRRDSTTIPGALMADIWMRIRADLLENAAG